MSRALAGGREAVQALALALALVSLLMCTPRAARGQTRAVAEGPAAASADTLAAGPVDTLMAAPADTLAVAPADPAPQVRDFFDTGIDGTAAVLASPVFPGWGQLYAGTGWRAMLAFGAQWYFWSNLLSHDRQAVRYRRYEVSLPAGETRDLYNFRAEESWELMRDYAWWSGGILLLVALDAYVGAGLYGFDTEPVPVPDRFDEYFDEGTPTPPGADAPQLVLWQYGGRF